MTTASTVPHDLRETTKDAREGAREIKDAAAGASRDIADDLQALRDDFGRLAEQVGQILSDRGSAAWRRARTSVDGVVSDAQDKSQEAVDAMREVSDTFVAAIALGSAISRRRPVGSGLAEMARAVIDSV